MTLSFASMLFAKKGYKTIDLQSFVNLAVDLHAHKKIHRKVQP